MKRSSLLLVFLSVIQVCFAQNDSIPEQQLDTVLLQVNRIPNSLRKSTSAISVYSGTQEDVTRQQTSLQEFVQQAPGVFTQNATNFAQDLRISIRGFGARSSFGIRGIKLIVDGIPETTPDGQGQLDNLNLGIIERLEIIKGSSSSLYGNASGGVISLTTKTFDTLRGNFSTWKVGAGSFGFQNYQATAGIGDADANYLFHANYGRSNGYRDQSGFEQVNTNFKGAFRLRENIHLTTILNYSDSPLAEDPGGLTLEEVQHDRRQARQNNIDFATEEAVQQFKVGASLDWQLSKKTAAASYAFYSNRQFNGKLPFEFGGAIDLGRNYMGQGASISHSIKNNTLKVGYDFGYQSDDRKRFRNLEGDIGEQTLDQKERFTNVGIYLLDHLTLNKWYLTGGIRYDYNKLVAQDAFLSNGDDSGDIILSSFNPSLGVNYELSRSHTIFTNLSTSFETPTLSELSANPSGIQGFNEGLEAQKSINLDLGIRSVIGSLQYSVVGFLINTKDDLVPFELAAFPDREFFRNAGETERIGVEVEGSYAFAKAWKATFSYAFSEFRYSDYQISGDNFEGNFLPGIPKHNTSIELQHAAKSGFHASVIANLVGAQFANDSNDVQVSGYELINVRVGYVFDYRNAQIRPYLGANNLLNQEYTDNVRINAFGGRYFEPAPQFNIFGGIVVDL